MSIDLLTPVPNLDEARDRKAGYEDHPINADHPLHDETLIPVSEVGLNGYEYWVVRNNLGDLVEGLPSEAYLRRSVAQRIVTMDDYLRSQTDIAALFGVEELSVYVDSGYRNALLQHVLYHEIIPTIIKDANPGFSDEAIAKKRDEVIAKPSPSAPHATGAVADLVLVNAEMAAAGEVKRGNGSIIDTGFGLYGESIGGSTINTDHFEDLSDEQLDQLAETMAFPWPNSPPRNFRLAKLARRVLYNLATDVGGLVNNPTELWHYGLGDPLSARQAQEEFAIYGEVPVIPDVFLPFLNRNEA